MDKIMSDETISAYSVLLNDRLNQMAVEHDGKISTLSALFSDISAYTPPPSIYETMSALSASAFLSDNTLSPNLYETALSSVLLNDRLNQMVVEHDERIAYSALLNDRLNQSIYETMSAISAYTPPPSIYETMSALFSDISACTPPPNFYEGIASHSALLFSLFDIVSNDINLLEESILLELDCDKKELFKAHKNLILDALFYASEDYETLLESEKQLMSHGGFIIDLLDGETVKINSVPVLIPLSGDMIKKFISIAKIFYKHLNHDENIDPSILTNQQMEEFTDQQKKEFLVYSYSLIKHLFPKATANLHPMKIEEVSTFEMLETLREWVENNCGDLLPYFKHFISNNWIKEGIENSTLSEIKQRGGAVWLSPDGDILFRPQQTAKIVKLEKAKAQSILANYLDRGSVRLLTGTKEVNPDIFPNELLCVMDKFTPFAKSEFLEIDAITYRTPWRPTEYMSAKSTSDKFEDIEMLLQRLTNHNPTYYQWVINWMAGFLQTRKRSQCALVLKGDQGSGKGILFEHIISPLFGEEYSIVIDDDRLHSNFKNWISGNLFYNLNEISHDIKTRKAVKNFIKQLVTDTRVQAEQKYKDAGAIEIFGQVLITSNELAPLEIETSDRRFTIIQTDKALKKDGIDTTKLIEDIKRQRKAFASFLLSYKVDWTLFDTALDTPEKRAVVNATTDKVVLLGNAIKMRDISFFEPMEETNLHLYNLVCEDLGKGRLCQSHLKDIYDGVFDDIISAKHIITRLATFDVSIFGETKKSNGKKYYSIRENSEQ